jgi:hypothetical protein
MQRGAIADEMEAPEAVRVRLALDPLDLGADAGAEARSPCRAQRWTIFVNLDDLGVAGELQS